MKEKNNVWLKYDKDTISEIHKLSDEYKEFISKGKTERLCVELTEKEAIKHNYINLSDAISNNIKLASGSKIYATYMNKAIILVNIGTDNIENGLNILGAHIDSPRLDLKQNPLYEKTQIAYFDTHYYGGIKKYQWVTIPLALYGVVVKKDGTLVNISLGDNANDPVFCISDLLIHLSQEQLQKKAATVIEGENLDVIVGTIPMSDDEKASTKNYILKLLKDYHNIEEDDFISAELEVVPAGYARDLGFDKSMVIGYGQDDRICAFTSLKAMLEVDNPSRTSVCILVDKEEIGSVGATGMESYFFENTIAEILNLMGNYNDITLRRTLQNSHMLSSDVSAAFDPSYESAFERNNAAYLGHGIVFNKYTGARGKSGSNDANAEYIAKLRYILEQDNVTFQTSELGRVDLGGGGTIAYIPAKYGMNVIDSGVALLNMHAPWEISSKADIYEAYKGYMAFLKYMK